MFDRWAQLVTESDGTRVVTRYNLTGFYCGNLGSAKLWLSVNVSFSKLMFWMTNMLLLPPFFSYPPDRLSSGLQENQQLALPRWEDPLLLYLAKLVATSEQLLGGLQHKKSQKVTQGQNLPNKFWSSYYLNCFTSHHTLSTQEWSPTVNSKLKMVRPLSFSHAFSHSFCLSFIQG